MTPRDANADLLAEITALRERVASLTREKTQADAQAATSEILRLISSSPTDVQPVFNTIAESAARLCDGIFGAVYRLDGEMVRMVAHHNVNPEGWAAYRALYPRPLNRQTNSGRAMLDGRVAITEDIEADTERSTAARDAARRVGLRSAVTVPLLHNKRTIGALTVGRAESGAFSPKQVTLLQTFADQAVIAIENVRLLTETKEALEQQTATSEILRVISRSPTDTQPVFDAIAAAATRLCDAVNGLVMPFDGRRIHLAAHYNVDPERLDALRRIYPMPPNPGAVSGRVILRRAVVHVPDVNEDRAYTLPAATTVGYRSVLGVPLLRDGLPLGMILIARDRVAPFSDTQIALLQTFADQAVIAIENVRLFTELQEKNSALTTAHAQVSEALDQQTATSEILRVISQSPTDAQPVFDAIVHSTARLCDATYTWVYRVKNDLIHFVAAHHPSQEAQARVEQWFQQTYPLALVRSHGVVARAIVDRAIVHEPDLDADPEVPEMTRRAAHALGFRSGLVVPMLRDGVAIGAIGAARNEIGGFSERQIELVTTFADQAVIAIENVRLFTELQEKNRALTESLEQQTATSEILEVISSSQTDTQPVFEAIADSALRLFRAWTATVCRVEGEFLLPLAARGGLPGSGEASQYRQPLKITRESVSGRCIVDRAVVHVADVQTDADAPSLARELATARGFRAVLGVPLLRDAQAIGSIAVSRVEPGPFSDSEIALLKTFADQAVIATENVRLFTQTKEALERQTATSEILRVISSSPTDLQPVFSTIVENAARLCDARFTALFRFDGELITVAVQHGSTPEELAVTRAVFPTPATRGTAAGRAILERGVVHIRDIRTDPEYGARAALEALGYRTALAVPMLRHDNPIGVLLNWRREVRPFTDAQIELVKTFADQAVIAIENVRLFKELETRTDDLTRSVGELRALGEVGQAISSTLDLQTVLGTIVGRAVQLSDTDAGVIYEYDEQREVFVPRATEHLEAEVVETMLATPVRRGEGATGRLAEVQEPIQVPDILAAPAESRVRGALVRAGYRALLAVPLVREGHLIGGLTVIRKATGTFAAEVIDLLQTFATQSSLAIQNARLFREIEDKSRQLEVASQHKSEFLANMSHELRTPLNAIIGFSEVLSERMFGELNEKQEEYSKDIHASGQHLLSLINDILDLSKIEAGRMELELSDFHLPTALDSALTLVRERAGRRSIALQMNVDSRLGQIQADERKVRQVVLNLLSNAIKFTPEGGRIEVSALPRDGSVEVSVSDTGVGIAPEDHEAVFQEFRQVGTADKKAEGTGLGLTLCRKFIELHGGRIWVKSQVGAGSTFTFSLPLRNS